MHMSNTYSLQIINRQISSDLTALALTTENHSIGIDETVLAVAIPLTHLDFDHLTPMEKDKKHVKRIHKFLDSKAKRDRFCSYTLDDVKEALLKEWWPQLAEDENIKKAFLSEVRIIDHIDDANQVFLDEKLFEVYQKTHFQAINYGTSKYSGAEKKKK